MKCVCLLIVSALVVFPADFNTGQAGRLVIGQETFTSQLDTPTDSILGGVGGVAFANNFLFVADSSRAGAGPLNNRVLVYPNVSGMLPLPTDQLDYTRKCPTCLGTASVVLGQPDFTTTTMNAAATQNNLRLPTAVASDGTHLAVADTDHNRVLIWNRIPLTNNANADVVVGQANFTSASIPGQVPTARSLRGPQGVWIQDGKLFVADTQNNRVLIWNSIPTQNGQAADIVLGQKDFTTFVQFDISQANVAAQSNNLLNPVSVTTDGVRLFVSDLGFNRVLIWNSIPTQNQAPADVVIGQPDMNGSLANNSYQPDPSFSTKSIGVLCASDGTDDQGNATFPESCNSTLSFPRFALSNGTQLFIADGGNDRVLVYKSIPTQNGQAADYVIGQLGGDINQASDAVDSLRTPNSLAWDGTNLYVADSYNRRIMVYSPAVQSVPYTGVRNAASLEIFAVATVTFAGSIQENDEATITIQGKDYKYKIQKDDTLEAVVNAFVSLINNGDGDQNVIAYANTAIDAIILKARASGDDGNQITLATSLPSTALITATTSGANLSGGQDAAKVAPGTLVTIVGDGLADTTAQAPSGADPLPNELGRVQVYFNGIRAPLLYVSPTQINAQIPFEFTDTTSVNAYVRTMRADGSVTVSSPVAVTIVPQNPGLFVVGGSDPAQAVMTHSSSRATGTVSVDGTANKGDVATVKIEDRSYSYTVQDGDTLASIRDAMIALINQDPKVEAFAAGSFTRIRLRAKLEGPEGNGIPLSASTSDGAQVIMTATNSALCCANVAGSAVTPDNPAQPGETIVVYATGLGMPKLNDNNKDFIKTGYKYQGPAGPDNDPASFVSSLAGGKTANVLSAGLWQGTVGAYKVELELNSDLPTNPLTQLTIAQDIYVSNIVNFPVVNPNAPGDSPQGAASGNITLTATGSSTDAQQPPAAATNSSPASVAPPEVGGVVNAASWASGPVAPGEFITIGGTGIGPAGDVQIAGPDGSGFYPTTFQDTQVLFDGIPAPFYYASANQTSVIVPYNVAGRVSTRMVVVYQGVQSAPVDLQVADTSPGIFTQNNQGDGAGVIQNQDYSMNTPSNPAAKGSIVILWATCEGQTSEAGVSGQVIPPDINSVKKPVLPVTATVGGQAAKVIYAGSAPGDVSGVFLVHLEVPPDAPSGDAVPIQFTVGTRGSQTGVTVAIE
jgi:uncharacterized protein (TIGR03437 family)